MDKIKIDAREARMILAAFNVWETHARSDEPHWTYDNEYISLKKRMNEFYNKEHK